MSVVGDSDSIFEELSTPIESLPFPKVTKLDSVNCDILQFELGKSCTSILYPILG